MHTPLAPPTLVLWLSMVGAIPFGCSREGGAGTPLSSGAGGASDGLGVSSSAGAAGTSAGKGGSVGPSAGGAGDVGSERSAAGAAGAGAAPTGVPYVFVGSTNGMLRAFLMDANDGSLSPAGSIDGPDGLDFIALGPDDRTLFATRDSAIAAYFYDPVSQSFKPRGDARTAGGGTHVAVDPSGRHVFVAHYGEGALSLLPYSGEAGFGALTSLSPGANAHQVRIDASGRRVYVPCLGSNHIAQYELDPALGRLSPASTPAVSASGGPRHMDFNPTGSLAYVLAEKSSQLHVYAVDPVTGSLALRGADSVYTHADGQYHWSSDVHVTPDGRFLYATNRDPSELVLFAVRDDGGLERLASAPLDGVVRSFAMDPLGRYLQVGGDSGELVAYRIDATGALRRTVSTSGLGNVRATIIRYLE